HARRRRPRAGAQIRADRHEPGGDSRGRGTSWPGRRFATTQAGTEPRTGRGPVSGFGHMKNPRGTNVVALSIPAKPEYIALCRLALTGLAQVRAVGPEALADLKVALTE